MEHKFGGEWTNKKLENLAKYLPAFTTALKNTSFSKEYIDAFAGTGNRATDDPLEFADGSVSIALQTEPPFDHYRFIEKHRMRCRELEKLSNDYPHLKGRIDVVRSDGNAYLKSIATEDWSRRRAVLFLDPYGLQVEFETMRAVANTRAIDVWILVPIGAGMNRMLTKNGQMPISWQQRLDTVFGCTKWRERFYAPSKQGDLFDDSTVDKIATWESIREYYKERMASIFAAVHPRSTMLMNSKGSPLYSLCFAVSNPNAKHLAFKIADYILKD